MHDDYKQLDLSQLASAPPNPVTLEPCPVCASAAQLWQYSESETSPRKLVVMCSNGKRIGPQDGLVNEGCPFYMPRDGHYRETIRDAIRYWNELAKAITALRASNAAGVQPSPASERGKVTLILPCYIGNVKCGLLVDALNDALSNVAGIKSENIDVQMPHPDGVPVAGKTVDGDVTKDPAWLLRWADQLLHALCTLERVPAGEVALPRKKVVAGSDVDGYVESLREVVSQLRTALGVQPSREGFGKVELAPPAPGEKRTATTNRGVSETSALAGQQGNGGKHG